MTRKIPSETFDNAVLMDSVREYPSMECLSKEDYNNLEKRIQDIMYFEDTCRTPFETSEYIIDRLSNRPGFEELKSDGDIPIKKTKYFFRDPWDGDAVIAVKEGELPITEGINILVTHGDSPCLRLKPKPIVIKWAEDQKFHYLGVRLSATAHGGLSVHQWPAQQLRIVGYTDSKGSRRKIETTGILPDFSGHVETRSEEEIGDAFNPDKVYEIITGDQSTKEILERFEFDSIDDFANAKLFAVPNNPPMPINDTTWRLLAAYGHDNRICTYAALDALVRSRNQKRTCMLYITDNEEVGESLPSGIEGPFFDHVLDRLIEKSERKTNQRFNERDRRRILGKSSLIYGDINIAPVGPDAEDMDIFNAPKIGLGVQMQTDPESVSSLKFVEKLRNLARQGIKQRRNIPHQILGNMYLQSQHEIWQYEPHQRISTLSQVGEYCTNVGVPCGIVHSPNEIICPGDEFWTEKFYQRFIERNVYG